MKKYIIAFISCFISVSIASIIPTILFYGPKQAEFGKLFPGVVNEVPDPSEEPPDASAYQLIVEPLEPVAAKSTVPVPHREPSVEDAIVGDAIVTELLVVEEPSHPPVLTGVEVNDQTSEQSVSSSAIIV